MPPGDQGSPAAEARAPTPPHLRSLRERLIHGSAWVLVGKALTSVFGLLANALLARILPPGTLGAYFIVFTMAFFGGTVAQLGTDRAVVRLISAAMSTGRPGRARSAVRKSFLVTTLGGLALGAVLALGLGRWTALHVYHSLPVAGVIGLGAAWLIAMAFQSLVAESFRGIQDFRMATVIDVLMYDVLCTAVFGALFVAGAKASLWEVVFLSLVITVVIVVMGAAVLRNRVGRLRDEGDLPNRELFAISWPLLVVNVSNFLLGTGVDLWILGAFRSKPEVAVYGAASRLVLFVAMPFVIVQQVTPPLVAEMYALGKKRLMQNSLRSVATLAGLPATIVLIGFLFFGRSVLTVVFGDFYARGATVLAVLSFGRLVGVYAGSSGVALMMTAHQRTMMYITIFSGVVSVVGDLVAAPHFGALGVAVATSVAVIIQNLLQLFYARRKVGVWTHAELSLRPFLELLGRERRAR